MVMNMHTVCSWISHKLSPGWQGRLCFPRFENVLGDDLHHDVVDHLYDGTSAQLNLWQDTSRHKTIAEALGRVVVVCVRI